MFSEYCVCNWMDVVSAGEEQRLAAAWGSVPLQEKDSQGELCCRKDCKSDEGVKGLILLLLPLLWVLTLVSKGEVPAIK